MKFSERQTEIIEIVRDEGPITGDEIAEKLGLSRATIRSDLSVLTIQVNLFFHSFPMI